MTPIDGGEIVVFCPAMAVVMMEDEITVAVVRLKLFVLEQTGGDFMMLVLVSTDFDLISTVFGFTSTIFGSRGTFGG